MDSRRHDLSLVLIRPSVGGKGRYRREEMVRNEPCIGMSVVLLFLLESKSFRRFSRTKLAMFPCTTSTWPCAMFELREKTLPFLKRLELK